MAYDKKNKGSAKAAKDISGAFGKSKKKDEEDDDEGFLGRLKNAVLGKTAKEAATDAVKKRRAVRRKKKT